MRCNTRRPMTERRRKCDEEISIAFTAPAAAIPDGIVYSWL